MSLQRQRAPRRLTPRLGLAAALVGCAHGVTYGPARDAMGSVAALEIAAVPPSDLCGSPFALSGVAVTAVMKDGSRRRAVEPILLRPEDPVSTSDLETRASMGSLTPALAFQPPPDALPAIDHDLVIDVWLREHPERRAQLRLPPRFDCPELVALAGRAGRDGLDGRAGQTGEAGPLVRVVVGLVDRPNGSPLVLVRVDGERGMLRRTLLSPSGPPLRIDIGGGPGGAGGTINLPGVLGAVLPDGPGGDGGDGGAARLEYDLDAPELADRVLVSNRGGAPGFSGRQGGRPGRDGEPTQAVGADARSMFRDEIARGLRVRAGAKTAAGSRI